MKEKCTAGVECGERRDIRKLDDFPREIQEKKEVVLRNRKGGREESGVVSGRGEG